MGEIKQGILGGFSGKVGTVIGSSWKNVSYMRAMAISINNPRTPKQQHQRTKFAMSINFLQAITPYVRTGYKSLATGRTAFNAAMSCIMRQGISGSGLDLTVDYNRVLVARGHLMPVFNATATVAASKVSFTWTDNSSMGDALGTDIAMPLAYNKARGEAVYLLDAGIRQSGKAELTLPTNWADDALAIYLAFRSENGERIANSVCLKDDPYQGSGSGSENPGGGNGGGDNENPLG